MSYDCQTYLLAKAYGGDQGLTDAEISRLAQHVQDELESEIALMRAVRRASTPHTG